MSVATLFESFGMLADAPNGVQKLRELILQLAVQGKLVPQNSKDEPAENLLSRISNKRTELIEKKKIKRNKPPVAISTTETLYQLPNCWKWIRLSEICSLITDGTHSTPTYTFSGVPFLSVNNLKNSQISFEGCKYISLEEHIQLSKRCLPEKGDILFGKVGSIGVCDVVSDTEEFSIFVQLALIKPFQEYVNSFYIKYAILSKAIQEQIFSSSAGSALQYIGIGKIQLLAFPLPPLEEQNRIVAKVEQLMSLCDELEHRQKQRRSHTVQLNDRALAHLLAAEDADEFAYYWGKILDRFDSLYSLPENVGALRRSVLQLAVQGKLVPQDPKDEPAITLLEKIQSYRILESKKRSKASLLPLLTDREHPFMIPDSWEWTAFSNIATIASNLVKPELYLDSWHVAPDNIEKQTGRLLPYRTVREDEVRSANHRFFSGQILYSKIRPNLAKVVLVDFDGLCSADMYPIDALIDPHYLLLYMLSETFLSMAVKKDTRVAMPKINQEELNQVLVAVPPVNEQKRIVNKFDQLSMLCDELEEKLRESSQDCNRLTSIAIHNILNAG